MLQNQCYNEVPVNTRIRRLNKICQLYGGFEIFLIPPHIHLYSFHHLFVIIHLFH